MKKLVAMLLTAAMTVGMLAGCGSKPAESGAATSTEAGTGNNAEGQTQSTIDMSAVTLMSDGVLTVGCEVGYPPLEDFAEDGVTPIGYDIDLITEVARRLGLEVNVINTAWDGIFAGIDVNYDVVCSAVSITPERKETMLFSDPYLNSYQSVVVPTGSDLQITDFNSLNGMAVAVQKETASDILLSDYKSTGTIDVEIVANEKVTSCFTQLTNGEIDAILVDSTVSDGYVAKEPDKYMIAYKDEAEPEQFGVAMGMENTALQAAINQALAEMEADGFIDEIYDYWFGAGAQ